MIVSRNPDNLPSVLRFVLTIVFHIVHAIAFILTMKKALRNPELSRDDRWNTARKIGMKIVRLTNASVRTFGEENLPKEGGYLFVPNHQGRFDGLAVSCAHSPRISFILDEARSDMVMEGDYLRLAESVPIPLGDARGCMEAFRKVRDRVISGDRFCVFPEGGYVDNGNTMREFRTGCLHYVKQMKCPIVPVCLFDSWRVYNYTRLRDAFRHVDVQVHILKPIMPQEYMNLSKTDMAALIKSRIQAKLDELTAGK